MGEILRSGSSGPEVGDVLRGGPVTPGITVTAVEGSDTDIEVGFAVDGFGENEDVVKEIVFVLQQMRGAIFLGAQVSEQREPVSRTVIGVRANGTISRQDLMVQLEIVVHGLLFVDYNGICLIGDQGTLIPAADAATKNVIVQAISALTGVAHVVVADERDGYLKDRVEGFDSFSLAMAYGALYVFGDPELVWTDVVMAALSLLPD